MSAGRNPDQPWGIIKRSVTLAGHSTSVSLEQEFWEALKEIAGSRSLSVPALIASIDQDRRQTNLSSAIRVHVLGYFQTLSTDRAGTESGPSDPPLVP